MPEQVNLPWSYGLDDPEQGVCVRRLILGTALILGLATPAIALSGPRSIPIPDGFNPEGVVVNHGNTFFVGSLADGDIYQGDLRSGEGNLLVDTSDRMAVGMSVDRRGDRLFVAGGATGQVYVYDISDGSEVMTFDVVDPSAGTFLNDVVVTKEGAYITDSVHPRIIRIPLGPSGELGDPEEILLSGPGAEVPGDFNLNGIEVTVDGVTLIVVHSALGALFTVDPDTGATTEIDLGGADVANGDGILLDGHTLWVVQNFLNQVSGIHLSKDLSSGEVVTVIGNDDVGGLFRIPTTVAEKGGKLVVVNARFDTPPGPGVDYDVVVFSKK